MAIEPLEYFALSLFFSTHETGIEPIDVGMTYCLCTLGQNSRCGHAAGKIWPWLQNISRFERIKANESDSLPLQP